MILGKDKGKGRYSAARDRSHGEITERYPGFYEKHFFVMAITFGKGAIGYTLIFLSGGK
jgi:hypothetical protein